MKRHSFPRTIVLAALLTSAVSSFGLAAPQPASAASGSHLGVSWVSPGSVPAGTSARYEVRILNSGNRNSSTPTTLQITLPITANSPGPRIMGTVSNLSPGCSLAALKVTCSVASIARYGGVASVSFDMVMPVKAGTLDFSATAASANNLNPSSTAAFRADQSYHTVSDAAPATLTVTLCSGTSALTSFFECVPGSTMTHQVGLAPGGVLDFTVTGAPYTGSWSVSGTQLTMTYVGPNNSSTFVGQGADAKCWEGPMIFSPTTRAMYRVCRP